MLRKQISLVMPSLANHHWVVRPSSCMLDYRIGCLVFAVRWCILSVRIAIIFRVSFLLCLTCVFGLIVCNLTVLVCFLKMLMHKIAFACWLHD